MSFLLDPVWLSIIISLVGVVLSLLTSLMIYIKQKVRKEVCYDIIASIPVINDAKYFSHKIEILFQGNTLRNATVLILRLWNSGNTPIQLQDYTEPIAFGFGMQTKLLDAEVLETKPIAVNVPLTCDKETLIVGHILLNSKDSVTLKVLLTDFDNEISVRSRIAGVRKVLGPGRVRKPKEIQAALLLVLLSSTLLGIIATISTLLIGIFTLIAIACAVIPLLLSILVIFRMFAKSMRL